MASYSCLWIVGFRPPTCLPKSIDFKFQISNLNQFNKLRISKERFLSDKEFFSAWGRKFLKNLQEPHILSTYNMHSNWHCSYIRKICLRSSSTSISLPLSIYLSLTILTLSFLPPSTGHSIEREEDIPAMYENGPYAILLLRKCSFKHDAKNLFRIFIYRHR